MIWPKFVEVFIYVHHTHCSNVLFFCIFGGGGGGGAGQGGGVPGGGSRSFQPLWSDLNMVPGGSAGAPGPAEVLAARTHVAGFRVSEKKT